MLLCMNYWGMELESYLSEIKMDLLIFPMKHLIIHWLGRKLQPGMNITKHGILNLAQFLQVMKNVELTQMVFG